MLTRIPHMYAQIRCISNNTIFALSSGILNKKLIFFSRKIIQKTFIQFIFGIFEKKDMANAVLRSFEYLVRTQKPP